MKTLIKLANSLNKACSFKGYIIFEGNVARATNIDLHAVIDGGEWNFDCATVVDSQQIKMALAVNPKKPVWSGDTLNGVKLVSVYQASDFPELPAYDGVRIECNNFSDAIVKTLPAAADNDIRYYLNSICFNHTDGAIIGCNGHRLHIVNSAYPAAPHGLQGESIVPRSAFDIVGAKNVLNIGFTDKLFRMGYCGGYLVGKLIDGKFPDYSRVIPAASSRPHTVAFNGTQCDAVKTIVSVLKANKAKYPTLCINFDGRIEACDIRVPCFDSFVTTELTGKYDTGQRQYGINAVYLHDALSAAGSGTIASDTINDGLLITNGDFRAVVMPCRV